MEVVAVPELVKALCDAAALTMPGAGATARSDSAGVFHAAGSQPVVTPLAGQSANHRPRLRCSAGRATVSMMQP